MIRSTRTPFSVSMAPAAGACRLGLAGAVALGAAVLAPAVSADVSLHTLAFETEALDLDAGAVVTGLLPMAPSGADVKFAYNAVVTPAAVVSPMEGSGAEMAFVAGTAFDGVSLQSLPDLTFSAAPVDRPFTGIDTIVIRTDRGGYFKLGNAVESDSGVTFNVSPLE